MAVAILRLSDGLDYSKVTEDDDQSAQASADITLTQSTQRSGLHISNSSHMLHADSNLNIANMCEGFPANSECFLYIDMQLRLICN